MNVLFESSPEVFPILGDPVESIRAELVPAAVAATARVFPICK